MFFKFFFCLRVVVYGSDVHVCGVRAHIHACSQTYARACLYHLACASGLRLPLIFTHLGPPLSALELIFQPVRLLHDILDGSFILVYNQERSANQLSLSCFHSFLSFTFIHHNALFDEHVSFASLHCTEGP